MSTRYFHFTLGPVQAFVAQARRTRDFWAGSFLLSWLSGIAMQAVLKQGGKIQFPSPDEAFLEALTMPGAKGPRQGNIPNRFKAKVDSNFEPQFVTDAVQTAWMALANEIWKNDFDHHLEGEQQTRTKAIWDRQIKAFWDMQWVLVDGEVTSDGIDRLKNLRTQLPPDEPGVKCNVMDGWQELSGVCRPNREALDAFWEPLRESKENLASDLREGETLCAIAFVKRRFARYFNDFCCELDGWTAHGWKIPTAQPSTYYLAAAHWLAQVIRDNTEEKISAFYDAARTLDADRGEWDNELACIRKACEDFGSNWGAAKNFASLDGRIFFQSVLDHLLHKEEKESAKKAKALLHELTQKPPPPFYALLLMDGDQLGKYMGNPGNQKVISQALNDFTYEVGSIVEKHNGFLVYAGGDDVFALLPIEDALSCAYALRTRYRACFEKHAQHAPDIETSLSGAIEYAHVKLPLAKLLADIHPLLDDIAKEDRGRDAIACRIWKPGGMAAEWATTWEHAEHAEHAIQDGEVELTRLSNEFRKNQVTDDDARDMASRFLYRLRQHFETLENDTETLEKVLAMEYRHSGLANADNFEEARQRIKPLLDQCRERKQHAPEPLSPRPDAAMLMRFLAFKGAES